jgi:hypothetical protein
MREYVAIIWMGDDPGVRCAVMARSLEEARAEIEKQFGQGHVISIYNEEDAQRPR